MINLRNTFPRYVVCFATLYRILQSIYRGSKFYQMFRKHAHFLHWNVSTIATLVTLKALLDDDWILYGPVAYAAPARVRGLGSWKCNLNVKFFPSLRLPKNGFFAKPPSTLPSFGSFVSILGCLVGAAQLTIQVRLSFFFSC